MTKGETRNGGKHWCREDGRRGRACDGRRWIRFQGVPGLLAMRKREPSRLHLFPNLNAIPVDFVILVGSKIRVRGEGDVAKQIQQIDPVVRCIRVRRRLIEDVTIDIRRVQ